MPLTTCSDCGTEVSTRANACPKCGAPMQIASPPEIVATVQTPPALPPPALWTPRSDALGALLLVIPLIATAILLSDMFGVILLTEVASYSIIIGTIFLTALLIAIEASQLGMGSRVSPITGKAAAGPVAWFFWSLALWIIAYPDYLFTRSRFGAKNYLTSGIFIALLFAGTPFLPSVLDSARAKGLFTSSADTKSALERQVKSSIEEQWAKNPKFATARILSFQLVHQSGNQYIGLLKANVEGEDVQLTVDVTCDGKAFMMQIRR